MADKKTDLFESIQAKTPEEEAEERIEQLRKNVEALEQELKTLEGRFTNRDPAQALRLEKENTELAERLDKLEKCLVGIFGDLLRPRQLDEAKLQHEVLREAAVQFCKISNIDADIWRSIVY